MIYWRQTIVLAFLIRAAEPVTMHQLGLALGLNHTDLDAALRNLEGLRLVERQALSEAIAGFGSSASRHGRYLYEPTPAALIALQREAPEVAA